MQINFSAGSQELLKNLRDLSVDRGGSILQIKFSAGGLQELLKNLCDLSVDSGGLFCR